MGCLSSKQSQPVPAGEKYAVPLSSGDQVPTTSDSSPPVSSAPPPPSEQQPAAAPAPPPPHAPSPEPPLPAPEPPPLMETPPVTSDLAQAPTSAPLVPGGRPAFAARSVLGQRMSMEDQFYAQLSLFSLKSLYIGLVNGGPENGETGAEEGGGIVKDGTSEMGSCAIHYFSVFDGHGGADVAKHCSAKLHLHLQEIIARVQDTGSWSEPGSFDYSSANAELAKAAAAAKAAREEWGSNGGNEETTTTMSAVTNTTSTAAVGDYAGEGTDVASAEPSHSIKDATTAFGNSASAPIMPALGKHMGEGRKGRKDLSANARPPTCPGPPTVLERALVKAFLKVDQELAKMTRANDMGTTAVVALLGTRDIWVANCGDSRAVLCRGGQAIALSVDHKATRQDEMRRVEKAGGYVWWDRVMGELAVSRAIGDHLLRPFVIAEPEVTRVARQQEDQLLVLASDGLWDVLSNQEAASLALEHFNEEVAKGNSSKAGVKKAVSALTRSALSRGSRDNTTVMVVDVRLVMESADSPQALLGDAAARGRAPGEDSQAGARGAQEGAQPSPRTSPPAGLAAARGSTGSVPSGSTPALPRTASSGSPAHAGVAAVPAAVGNPPAAPSAVANGSSARAAGSAAQTEIAAHVPDA